MRTFFLSIIIFSISFLFAQKVHGFQDKDKELDSLYQILEKHKPLQDTIYLNALVEMGIRLQRMDLEKSTSYFEEAIGLGRALGNLKKLCTSLLGVGINYGRQDNYAEAISNFREALQVAQQNNNADDKGSSLINLGIVYKRMGEYPTSISYYTQALVLYDSIGDENGLAHIYGNLGILSNMMEDHDKALEYYDKALEWYRSQNNKQKIALTLNNIGEGYLLKKEFDKAMEYLKRALENYDLPKESIVARINIGQVHYERKEYSKAESFLKSALEDSEELGFLQNQSTALRYLSKIQSEQGNHTQSVTMALRNKIVADSVASFNQKAEAEKLLADVYEKAGYLEASLEHLKKYNSWQDSIFNENKTKSYQNQQVMMEVHEKDKQLETQAMQVEFLNGRVLLENRWKWSLFLASLFLLIAGLLYYQKYKERHRYSNVLEFKNRVITEQKEQIEEINLQLEKRMLRAQMNPHFIFNSLSSIQYLINTDDKESALHYLSIFSKMLRQVLETSINTNMVLKDEVELIKTYLELEALRFEKNFSYKIHVDEKLDVESHEIPGMIIQPFVENAILHGLMPKEGRKELTIDIQENGPHIQCTITDNGIGREAAKRINEHKKGKSRSRGISVTQQRIALLAKKYGLETEIKYTDLFDDQGKSAGTTVEIRIPKQGL